MKRTLLAILFLSSTVISLPSIAQIGISVSFGPPPLPVYAQPPCPDNGYLWTPGYWAYDNYFGYYWVPGTWVLAPQPGLLWTPGWWGWSEGAFLFHEGYWAPHVGFYGGINYGHGFFGNGYEGGRWDGNRFYYNRAVSNVNVTNIHNVYNTTVVNNVTVNRVSYNGGSGGIEARPTHEQEDVDREQHVAIPPGQLRHIQMARANPQLRAEVNHGKPAIAATPRPAAFTGSHVIAARQAGGAYQAPERKLDHASSVSAHQAPSPIHQASPEQHEQQIQHEQHEPVSRSQGNQQQMREQQARALVDRQNQQHAQLQAQQEREHQQAQQRNLSDQRQRQMEQQHAQQTAQMEQRHVQQMQNLQRPQPASRPNQPAHQEPKPHR